MESERLLNKLIGDPKDGYRKVESFTEQEKEDLRPIAETLAMLAGNAFFGNKMSGGRDWYEMYLPQAYALFEMNGGYEGWAQEASFIKNKRENGRR